MAEHIRFNPGLILGSYGSSQGAEIGIVETRIPLYDLSGKRQNAVWSQTTSGGLFYIQFQWDAVEYAKVADPDYSTFQISYGHKGDYYQRDRSNRLYL